MAKETYPLPGQGPKLAYVNPHPEYGATRQQWEERVFRQASHFNVIRLTSHQGSFIATVRTFAEALYLTLEDKEEGRKLLYTVAPNGEAFCMSPKDYGKFAELTLKMREERHG